MKRITLILGLLALTSCKKTWTCECESSYDDIKISSTVSIPDQKKSNAKTICDDHGAQFFNDKNGNPLVDTYSCELKKVKKRMMPIF